MCIPAGRWKPYLVAQQISGDSGAARKSNVPVCVASGGTEAQRSGEVEEEVPPERASDGCNRHI